MKRASGTGGIRKLSGKRRKPYQAVITQGREWKNGRIVQKQRSIGVYATRREAQAALEEYCRFNLNIEYRNVKFSEVCEIIYDNFTDSMKQSMRSAYKKCEYLHDKRMIDIRKYDLDIVASQNEEMSASTQTNIGTLIRQAFKWCMDNDVLVKEYAIEFRKTKERKKNQSYTQEEVRTVLEHGSDLQKILLYSGMRINELLNMKTENVYCESGVLCFHITESKTESGKRIIPVHSKIEPLISLDGEYVIEPHSTYAVQKKVYVEWNKEHGINHNFHELRHTFATYGKMCGMDDFYRRSLLGHAQKGLTDSIYTHATAEELKKQIEKLDYQSVTL
jgi:integrase